MPQTSFYNREKPLLERKHVPCELLLSQKDASINPEKNTRRNRKAYFTLRVLQGHRHISEGSGASEQSIRLELSDEYKKTESLQSMKVLSSRMDRLDCGFPSCLTLQQDAHGRQQSHGPIHFPAFQTRGSSPMPFASFKSQPTSKVQEKNLDVVNDGNTCSDPIINLYELEVGESDFAQLRRDQALLVDFSDFSKSLIELLMVCDLGERDQDLETDGEFKEHSEHVVSNPLIGGHIYSHTGHVVSNINTTQGIKAPSSDFCCRIEDFSLQSNKSWNGSKRESSMARFSIVESNQFRELVHLSLNIQPGTDATVRSYVSARLREVIGQNSMLKFQLNSEKERADSVAKAYNEISQQYNQLVNTSETEKSALAQEADESLQKESAKRCEELQIIRRVNEEEIERLKQEMMEHQCSQQSKIDMLECENKLLSKKNTENDEMISELQNDLNKYDSSLRATKNEVEHLQEEFQTVKCERDELQKRLQDCSALNSELKSSKEEYQSRLAALGKDLTSATEETHKAHQEAEESSVQIRSLQQELSKAKEDCAKFQDLLSRYQRDRQEMKRRMKSKVEMIQKQEDILASSEFGATEVKEKLAEREHACYRLEQDLEMAKKRLAEAEKSLDENQKKLSSNQQVS